MALPVSGLGGPARVTPTISSGRDLPPRERGGPPIGYRRGRLSASNARQRTRRLMADTTHLIRLVGQGRSVSARACARNSGTSPASSGERCRYCVSCAYGRYSGRDTFTCRGQAGGQRRTSSTACRCSANRAQVHGAFMAARSRTPPVTAAGVRVRRRGRDRISSGTPRSPPARTPATSRGGRWLDVRRSVSDFTKKPWFVLPDGSEFP